MRLLGENRYPRACWGKREEWGKSYKNVYGEVNMKHYFTMLIKNIYGGYYLGIQWKQVHL